VTRKLRVLEFSNAWDLGGTEKTALLFMRHLDRARFDLFAAGWQGGAREDTVRALGIELFVSGDRAKMVEWIRAKSIDVVHFHRMGGPEPELIDTFVRGGASTLVEHNIFARYDGSADRRRIHRHLMVSKTALAAYRARAAEVDERKVTSLYNPVDIELFDSFPFDARDWRRPTFGRLSRPDDHKWHPINLEMLPLVRRAVPDAEFLVIGMPPSYRERARELGVADMITEFSTTTSQATLCELLHRMTVFTHSSRIGETFGMNIAEAMAAKLPVVTHSGGDGAQCELVTDGHNGFVVEPDDVSGYAERVVRLLLDPQLKRDLGAKGHARASELFHVAKLTRSLEAIFASAYADANMGKP
jgi:glycosyltransferase involved in cell wall biosynthesis